MSKSPMLIHRDMWEAKVLLKADGLISRVAMSIIARWWKDDSSRLRALFGLVWPGFSSIQLPFLLSGGRVLYNGNIAADLATKGENVAENVILYDSLESMQNAFRRLADRVKLNDKDRVELFEALQNWIIVDYRQRHDEVEERPRLNGAANG